MDKDLIVGLSNLSESLDRIADALSKKGESKTATGAAMQMGEFDKQIREISSSITEVKKDTQKLLDQQDTILKILKKKEKDSKVESKKEKVKDIPQESTPVKVGKDKKSERDEKDSDKSKKISTGKTSTEEVSKEKKNEKKPGFFGDMDTKKIKDGISSVLLIAVGIIAIGMALKLVGKVDFVSVMALALALPLIAFAFGKIAAVFSGQTVEDAKGRKVKTEKLNVKDIPSVILAMVGFSTAILVSSYILSKVKPVGLFQAVTSILIAGTFAVIAPSLGKMMRGFSGLSLMTMAKSIIFLPLVLLGVATAIMLSSYVLSKVKPIGLFQAMTAILIAGTFAVISYGLGKLLGAFKGINPIVALAAAVLMPILLLAISTAIMLSSYVLSKVKPIGLFQALSAIFIAATFAVISYGIGKIISAFKGINPVTAIAAAIIMPILFVALSLSIMISSAFLSKVRPIGLFQALTSIFIAATFVVLSYAVAKILPAFRRLSYQDALKASIMMPLLFTAMSAAILLSSYPLSKVKPIGFFQFLTGIGIAILFVAFAFALKIIVKAIRGISKKDVLKAGLIMVAMTTSIVAAGYLISKMPEISLGKIVKFALLSIALIFTTLVVAKVIKAISKVSLKDIVQGGLVIVAIATAIMVSSLILNLGKYDKYPTLKWALGVGLTMIAFGLAALELGTIITATAGLGAIAIAAGLLAVIAIAGTIVATDKIISTGSYTKYPGLRWAIGTGAAIVGFAAAVVTLGVINSVGGIASTLTFGIVKNPIDAGTEAVIKIAKVIVATDRIISSGQYTKFPGLKWTLGVGGALTAFGTAVVVLGALNSGGGLVQKLTLGLVKNPIDAGVDATIKIAKLIVATDKIISTGQYSKYPGLSWAFGVGRTITGFATAVVILGALNSGGGLAQKLTFGLVKNPIDAGIDAMTKVSNLIVTTDKILSKGSYTKGPGLKWSLGVGSVIGVFTTAMIGLGTLSSGLGALSRILGAKNPIDSGIEAIKKIATSIVDVDKILASGKYTGGPNSKWASGISLALGAFTPIYSLLVREKVMSIFGKGISASQYSDAIKMISSSIVDAANLFAGSTISFKNGPPVTWADGISKALGAFSPIYTLLLKNSGWFKSGVSPDQFAEAIRTISRGIVDSANFFGESKASFQNGPPVVWAEGVEKALGAFSPIYTLLLKNSGWFKSGVSADKFAEAIRTISQGIVDSANIFSKSKATFQSGPTIAWADGIGRALGAFLPIYVLLLKNSGWFKSGVSADKFADAIRTISRGIVDSANIFSIFKSSFKNGPSVAWADGVGRALGAFLPIYGLLLKNSGWFKSGVSADKFADAIKTISRGIVDSANIFSKSKSSFSNAPSVKWSEGVSKALSAFSPIYDYLSKNSGFFGIDIKDLNKSIIEIADTLQKTSTILSKGNYDKYPNEKWIRGISFSLGGFKSILSEYSKSFLSLTLGSISINSVVSSILSIDKLLSIGKYSKYPDKNWLNGAFSSIREYSKLISGVKSFDAIFGDFKINKIVNSILSIDKLLSSGKYNKFPDLKWIKGVGNSITEFSKLFDIKIGLISMISGPIKLNTIVNSIIGINKKLSSGNYNKYPDIKWVSGISNSISEFGKLFGIKLGVFEVLSGSFKLNLIVDKIIDINKKLSTGSYTKYPDTKWVKGISGSINEFSKLFSLRLNLSNILLGSFNLNRVVNSIVDINKKLSTGSYTKYPDTKWVKGITSSISEFSKLLSLKISLSDSILGLFNLNRVVNSIVDINKKLSTGSYTKYPDTKWVKGITSSINEFSKLFSLRLSISSILLGSFNLNRVVNSIVDINKKLSTGSYTKYPDTKWVKGITSSISEFSKLFSLKISLSDSILGLFNLNRVVNSIVDINKKLSSGNYTKYPDTKWVKGITSSINEFSKLLSLKISLSDSILGLFNLNRVVNSIVDINKKLSSGNYTKYPDTKWVKGITSSINEFSKLFDLKLNISSILLGSFNLNRIVNSIVDINKKLSSGNYTKYPDTKWVKGITSSINEFSKLFDLKLNISSILLGSFNLNRIVNSIVDVNKKLSSGNYTKYPDTKWIKGISGSITEFSKLFALKFNISSILFGSFNLNRIVNSIVDVNKKLSSGNYTKYPDTKWVKGITGSITEFSKLFALKISLSDSILGLFNLNRVVNSIVDVNKKLSSGNYTKYPDTKWVKGITSSINEFSKLFSLKFNISSILLGSFNLNRIVNSIVDIDKKLSSGTYNKYPDKKWLDGTFTAIREYSKLTSGVKLSDIIFGDFKINKIVNSILSIDKKLSSGKYQKYPNQSWINKTSGSILQFGKLAINVDKEFKLSNLLFGIMKMNLIVDSITSIDKKIGLGKYQKYPNQSWINKTSSSILQFGNLAINVDKKFGLISLMLGLTKIRKIADTIQQISLSLSKGNYTKFPSSQWSLGVPAAIKGFMSFSFGMLSGVMSLFKSDKAEKTELGRIVDLMLFVDKKLQSGNWKKFPSVQWVNGTILALQKFRSIMSLLSFSSFGDKLSSAFGSKNPLMAAVSNIEKLAVSFDKLSKSMKSFTDSIKNIDGEKLAAIRSLSTNVIMMSLMDPAQFDAMMDKLEERSGVFADLIKDFESKKTETTKSGGGGGGVSYKTAKPGAAVNTDTQILSKKLDLMNSFLADITSVVGSKGTLKNYLNRIKDDVSIGQNTLSQRSDKRVKNIIKKVGVSDNGINIYLFTYHFDPSTIYQGIIAQELIGSKYESALHVDKSGLYSVDYSVIDVEFKKTNL